MNREQAQRDEAAAQTDWSKQAVWLSPERIQRLYDGHKSKFGLNRLLIIGIGKNGVDCALRCMHITEKRHGRDKRKVRFLFIGEDKLLDSAEYEGIRIGDNDASEAFPIIPEDFIYKYLNNPAKLPDEALEWFDEGLKNYSPATPVYGLTKRQCGRIALFHGIKQLIKLFGGIMADFSGSAKPLDIILTGNLGDTFFGGMFIDLAYIIDKLFADVNYPVRINGCIFAADTAALIENGRDLGYYSANTIVAKSELDKFQLHRTPFRQKYSSAFEVDSDKPPFNACFLIPACRADGRTKEEAYSLTMNMTAEKILSRMEVLFSKDDDAERILSYNMLKADESHEFRYLAFSVKGAEIPMGKIMSYLGIRLFMRLNRTLNANNAGQETLNRYKAVVTPNAEYVASNGGSGRGMPTLDMDERRNPAFSAKAIRGDNEGALSAVETWISAVKAAVINGTDKCVESISDRIIADCEAAKIDFDRGPFYAQEIMKKCLAEIRVASVKIKSDAEDMAEQVERTRRLEREAMKKVKTAIFVNKAVEQYLYELDGYAKAAADVALSKPMLSFYDKLQQRLNEYNTSVLQKAIIPFESICVNRGGIIDGIKAGGADSCVEEAFSLDDEEIRAKLDKLAADIPNERLEEYFRKSGILNLPENDDTALAKAVAGILRQCFEKELSMDWGELCGFLDIKDSVRNSIKTCIDGAKIAAPVADGFSITRVLCPRSVRQEDIAELRREHRGISYIWNGSVCSHFTAAVAVAADVRLEDFEGYHQWENMHYAYVNDSLKKHGIKIF